MPTPEPVSIQVGGNVAGSIVLGDNNFVVNTNHGTIVYQQAAPQVRARQFVPQPPRAPRGFVNRTEELSKLETWIATNEIVLLHAPDGMGKSALLKQAANSAAAAAMPGGVILLEGVGLDGHTLGPDDVVQRLFDALFESNPPLKVDAVSARTYLSNTRPLVLMDEVGLSPALQKALPDLFPKGAILLSADMPFGSDFLRLSVKPLPRAESLTLLATKAELTLNDANRATLEKICALLDDVSLALVITANVLRETHTSPEAALQAIGQMPALERDPTLVALNRAFAFAFGQLSPEEQKVLSAAALTPGISMTPEWLSAALGGLPVDAFIERLKALGLLFANSPRLRVPPGLRAPAQRASVLNKDALMARLIEFLRAPLLDNSQNLEHIRDELGNFLGALSWAAQAGRPADVIALGRALDPYLTLRGLWDAWNTGIGYVLDAARQSEQKAVEAWALHQIGTRALGLGARNTALEVLRQALELRRTLGDTVGMAYTQHNINFLIGLPPPAPDTLTPKSRTPKPPKPAGRKPNPFLRWGGIGVFVILIILVLITVIWYFFPIPKPTPVTPKPPTLLPRRTATTLPPTKKPTLVFTSTSTPRPKSTLTPIRARTLTKVPTVTPTVFIIGVPVFPSLVVSAEDARTSAVPILYQGFLEDYFEIPVIVRIDNSGRATTASSSISIRYKAKGVSDFTAFRLDGENFYQYEKAQGPIAPGESVKFIANVKIPKTYQGAPIEFTAELDVCGTISCKVNSLPISLPLVLYDFIDNAKSPNWTGYDPATQSSYPLPFDDGSEGNSNGFVNLASGKVLEDGTTPEIVLYTHPTWVSHGRIMGAYYDLNGIRFKPGDLLVARVGLIEGGKGDGVTFDLSCLNVEPSFSANLFSATDLYDFRLHDSVVSLPDGVVKGSCPYFYLSVDAGTSDAYDWAAWVSAYIARP